MDSRCFFFFTIRANYCVHIEFVQTLISKHWVYVIIDEPYSYFTILTKMFKIFKTKLQMCIYKSIVFIYVLIVMFIFFSNRSTFGSNNRRNTVYMPRASESQSPLLLGSRSSGGSNTSRSQLSFDSSASSDHSRYSIID